MTEMRVYKEPNIVPYSTITHVTVTKTGFEAQNLFLEWPRTTSTERAPNGSPDVQSCAVFTEFPVEMTLNLGGRSRVETVLVIGNSATPGNSNNYRIYVGDSSDFK